MEQRSPPRPHLTQSDLQGRVAIVTGGSRGIGRATVEHFANAGATVLFTYQSENSKAIAEDLRQYGHESAPVIGYQVDASDPSQCQEFVAMVEREFGGVDILVNNAGIIRDGLLMTMEEKDWNQVMATNIGSLYGMTKPVLPMMLKKRRGSIVNLSSVAASRPGRGHSNYAASKGAVESFTKALAAEIGGKGIRVNAVAPGMIATDMSQEVRDAAEDHIKQRIALKRIGKPAEIARAILFLASDASSYITGAVLPVDGGAG